MSKRDIIRVGKLVSHYLYPRSWLALVLSLSNELDALTQDTKVEVIIVPGTEHINYFRNSSARGWIYKKWLWVPGEEPGSYSELMARCTFKHNLEI